jgi:SAM-dependent methyltransferase
MNEEVFNRYSEYYDLLYRDKDYVAETKYVGDSLRAVLPNSSRLLELGSGTGRHGRLLAKLGFEVFGVERSESMVKRAMEARQDGASEEKFECILGDIKSADLHQQFDAVISLFHVVSYQTSNQDVIQTFATAARHLTSGGIFFFDVWHGPAVLSERPSTRIKRVENDSIQLTRIAEPELDIASSVVTVRYTMFAQSKANLALTSFREEHRMRYFLPTEIDLLAHHAGFAVERSEEFLTGLPASDRTWGVAYLLRKI